MSGAEAKKGRWEVREGRGMNYIAAQPTAGTRGVGQASAMSPSPEGLHKPGQPGIPRASGPFKALKQADCEQALGREGCEQAPGSPAVSQYKARFTLSRGIRMPTT